jgi:hypothetical protein
MDRVCNSLLLTHYRAHSNSEIRESYYDGHEVLDWLEEDN